MVMRRLQLRYTNQQMIRAAVIGVASVVVLVIAWTLISRARDSSNRTAAKTACEQRFGAGKCVEQFGTWVPIPNAVPIVTIAPLPTDTPYAYVAPTFTPTPTPTLDPEQQLAKDRALITSLYQAFSKAWDGGPAGAETFLAQHDYAPYVDNVPSCRSGWETKKITKETYVPQESSIQPDANWTIPSGSQQGKKPSGNVYIMRIDVTTYATGSTADTQQVRHVTVINNKATLLIDCTQ